MTNFVFILYFVLMLGIGIYFYLKDKKNSEAGDKAYFLGGRKMGAWVTAMSAQASDMSAWLLMGLPGSILAFGLGQVWIAVGLALGTAANWFLVARRLRQFSEAAADSITLPQYLTNRFAKKSHGLSIICAIVFLVSFTIYVASSFVAGAAVFGTILPELDSNWAMAIFATILICYTFLGGFSAVSWTDLVQGSLMLIAVVSIPIILVANGALNASLLETTTYNGVELSPFVTSLTSAPWSEIVSGLGWGLGYFGMPHIIVRFMAIREPSMVRKSTIIALVWLAIALSSVALIAYFARMTPWGLELVAGGEQKLVFVKAASLYFPPFLGGILLSAVIAASMSTADSQLLVASSAFTTDIYKPLFRKDASPKEIQWMGRAIVLAVAVVAYIIASSKSNGAQAIMNMVENAWGLFGAAFGAVILLSLFWKRFTYTGAIAGISTGAIVDIAWLLLFNNGADSLICQTGVYEIIPGFFCAMAAGVIVSLLSDKPSAEVEEIFAKATAEEVRA